MIFYFSPFFISWSDNNCDKLKNKLSLTWHLFHSDEDNHWNYRNSKRLNLVNSARKKKKKNQGWINRTKPFITLNNIISVEDCLRRFSHANVFISRTLQVNQDLKQNVCSKRMMLAPCFTINIIMLDVCRYKLMRILLERVGNNAMACTGMTGDASFPLVSQEESER